MTLFVHICLFFLSAGIIWYFAGLVVDSIDKVAKRFHQTGFTVAFFVLGWLTSLSELSVMVNSSIQKTPQISAGNLAGASFVILLFIVPLLAIMSNGIQLRKTLSRRYLASSFLAICLPNLFMLDGNVTKREGLLILLVYGTLIYFIGKHRPKQTVPKIVDQVQDELLNKEKATTGDMVKIVVGALFIFLAGHLLVVETEFISNAINVPSSIIGLILLSVGTNVPELVVGIRSVLKKHKDIAFGNYLGSALNNAPTFGLLALINGTFAVESSEFLATGILLATGLIAFYYFAKSKNNISREEGYALIAFYGVFFILQVINIIRFATS